MKFSLGKHKTRPEAEAVELVDAKGRVLATIETSDDGLNLLIRTDYMERVGLEGGSATAGVLIKLVDPDKPKPEKK